MGDKPNILVIWGDDIGQSNLSCYSHGVMGYRTPNIDRIAGRRCDVHRLLRRAELHRRSGRVHHRPEPVPHRSHQGRDAGRADRSAAEDPTIATALKSLGYATGQFGKNHLGDRDEYLPTMHGFDEFFGNLYHLNAEEEPELDDYPSEEEFPNFRKNFGPRGVIHSWANGDGTQRIEDTGPLTKERMKTIDDEVVARGVALHDRRGRRRHAVLRVAEHHAHALPHPRQGRQPAARPAAGSRSTTTR